MTIDEAIEKARNNENSFKNNHKLNLTLKKEARTMDWIVLKFQTTINIWQSGWKN